MHEFDDVLPVGGAEPASAPAATLIDNPFTVRVFDPASFVAALDEDDGFAGPEDERRVFESHARTVEEEARARVLRKAAADYRGGERALLLADGGTLGRLRTAVATAPHFAAVTGIVERAVATAMATGALIRFPPILMVSEPGLGKTHYAKAIAGALGTRVVPIAMNATSDRGQLGGSSTAWRGAKTGKLAKAALECETASPLFLLDEIDKATSLYGENVASILLSAMEPENAEAFVDEYLDVPVRLDGALWLASANDATAISPPLLSRMLVVEIPRPGPEQARVVVRAIAAASSPLPLADDGVDLLIDLVPRQARQTIELAHPFAVCARRCVIGADDVRAALALSHRPVRRPIGFVSGAFP